MMGLRRSATGLRILRRSAGKRAAAVRWSLVQAGCRCTSLMAGAPAVRHRPQVYVLDGGGAGGATSAAGTAAAGEGAAVTEEPLPIPGTGAGAPARRLTHTTLLVRARRPVSARRTTAVDVEWLLAPCR
ncbi:unnamed protein product [Ectocarpus sp. CCAP 1310/34]|nr:unnamed protein product [Ectocarpus sp. CCAP 1310/34]